MSVVGSPAPPPSGQAGAPVRVTLRRRSPHAHGPDSDCPACTDCPSCDGGSGRTPDQYRVERVTDRGAPGTLVVVCSRCGGPGVVCHNLVPEPAR